MTTIIYRFLWIGFLFTSFVSQGQTLRCPIEGGIFKDFGNVLYSHHNPKDGAVILSTSNNKVEAVVDGKVSKIFRHGNDQYSIVLISKDSALVSYSFLHTVTVKEGSDVRNGDLIGQAIKGNSSYYELRFSCRIRSNPIDPKELIKCSN